MVDLVVWFVLCSLIALAVGLYLRRLRERDYEPNRLQGFRDRFRKP